MPHQWYSYYGIVVYQIIFFLFIKDARKWIKVGNAISTFSLKFKNIK